MDTFAEQLAEPTPTPGGGAAAARVGLFACSLIRMVLGITIRKMEAKAAEDPTLPHGGEEAARPLAEAAAAAVELSRRFEALEAADMAAFEGYLAALRLPRGTPEEKVLRSAARGRAALEATEVPLRMLESCLDVLALARRLLDLSRTTPLRAESDLGAAIELARAAFLCAELNVRVNLPELKGETEERVRAAWASARERLEAAYAALKSDRSV